MKKNGGHCIFIQLTPPNPAFHQEFMIKFALNTLNITIYILIFQYLYDILLFQQFGSSWHSRSVLSHH